MYNLNKYTDNGIAVGVDTMVWILKWSKDKVIELHTLRSLKHQYLGFHNGKLFEKHFFNMHKFCSPNGEENFSINDYVICSQNDKYEHAFEPFTFENLTIQRLI